jgi:RNA ligase (TIGR02306 family)
MSVQFVTTFTSEKNKMKLASIELISEIHPHPNADKLELAKVLGYTCIVEKDKYKVGDAVVLIQPDTVLPDKPWAEVFKKKSGRTKAIKLRGVWSFGIVMPTSTFFDETLVHSYLPGTEVSHLIDVTKYEAPQPQQLDAKGHLPFGLGKTDEERYQNILDLPFGEKVDVTLKIDGQSATYYCRKDRETGEWHTGICSRSLELKPECSNNYTRINLKYDILSKLLNYCSFRDVSLALRGEIYGSGIQGHAANPHSKLPLDFAAFSVYNFDTFQYENTADEHNYQAVCGAMWLPMVPTVAVATLTPELIKHYAEDISEIDGKPFEGVVIKHSKGSFKVINLGYDERK